MKVRGVVFDLGGTLMHFYPPGSDWEAMEKAGGMALISLMKHLGYSLPPMEEALEHIWDQMREAWRSIGDDVDPATLNVRYQLRQLLNGRWKLALSEADLMTAEHAYVTGSQIFVRPFPQAVQTVQALKARGFPIGLLSNTLWPGVAHQYDLMHFGLWEYFDFALFSSDEKAWKPLPAIFERAARYMNAAPNELVYIGDSLFFDVYGAQQTGFKTIWIEQSRQWLPPTLQAGDIIPDFSVKHIADVVAILEKQG